MELKELADYKDVVTTDHNGETIELKITKFSLDKLNHIVEYSGGQDKFQKLMSSPTPRDVCYIAWVLLDIKCKQKLFEIKFYDIPDDGDGKPIEINKKGHEKLMALLDTNDKLQKLADAIMKAFEVSMPEPQKGVNKGKK